MHLCNLLVHIAAWTSLASAAIPSPIPNTQNLEGPIFEGSPASGNPLHPKVQFVPETSQAHADSGNTGSFDTPGSLGNDTLVSSALQRIGPRLLGADGTLSGTRSEMTDSGQTKNGLAAYDPDTLEVLAVWFPEDNTTLNLAYTQMRVEDKSIVTSSPEGRIFVVQRQDSYNGTKLSLTRQIDVATFLNGQPLLNNQFDVRGNIWFTTGSFIGNESSFTVGFVTLEGAVHTSHFLDQSVRNGIAINGTDVYVITGPSVDGTSEEPGYMWKFAADEENGSVNTLWKAPYSAGSTSPVRGSGTTPSILGDEFITAVDNAPGRVNLLVYHQEAQEDPESQLLCAVPLFGNNASAVDNRQTVHFDGNNYTVAIQNTFGAPYPQGVVLDENINDSWNNLTVMAGGITQVSVTREGCHVTWENPIKMTAVPFLSTGTGVLHGYFQDPELSIQGSWIWYFVAIDWRSGEVLWRKRAGAGGSYNDQWNAQTIAMNGRVYQLTTVGTVWMDGEY